MFIYIHVNTDCDRRQAVLAPKVCCTLLRGWAFPPQSLLPVSTPPLHQPHTLHFDSHFDHQFQSEKGNMFLFI